MRGLGVRGRSCDDRSVSWWLQHRSGISCLPLTAASLPLLQCLGSALFTFNTCQAPERDRSPGLGLGGPAQAPGLSQHASQKCCFLEPSRLPVPGASNYLLPRAHPASHPNPLLAQWGRHELWARGRK